MYKIWLICISIIMGFFNQSFSQEIVTLPSPKKEGELSFEEVLNKRKSIRKFCQESLKLDELSQLLWAAYGKNGFRKTVPSAGALYPLVCYVIVGNVDNLSKGLYLYDDENHRLIKISNKDLRDKITLAALNQRFIAEASVVFVICARYSTTTSHYGERGIRYVHMEVGHVGQNIYLQATNLNLGTVAIGAFYDKRVKEVLGVKEDPLYIMPVGKIKNDG